MKNTSAKIAERYADPKKEFKSIEEYLRNDNTYILPYRKNINEETRAYDKACFHVAMMIKDKEIKQELVDRTDFEDWELEGKPIAVDAFFFCTETSSETNGINVNAVEENRVQFEVARLTDEEKLAFYNKVIEIVPESEPYVKHSIDIVMNRMEQEKEQPKSFNVDR